MSTNPIEVKPKDPFDYTVTAQITTHNGGPIQLESIIPKEGTPEKRRSKKLKTVNFV